MYRTHDTRAGIAVERIADGAWIPDDTGNADRAAYLEWRAAGNVPEHVGRSYTLADYQVAVVAHVDSVAMSAGYEDAADCASYTTSGHAAWAADAAAFVSWRDAVWLAAAAALASPPNPAPTPSQFVAALPVMEWPAE